MLMGSQASTSSKQHAASHDSLRLYMSTQDSCARTFVLHWRPASAAGMRPLGKLVAHANRDYVSAGCLLRNHSGSPPSHVTLTACAWVAACRYIIVPMPYIFFGASGGDSYSLYSSNLESG